MTSAGDLDADDPDADDLDGSARDGRSTRWGPHREQRRLAIITAAITAIERVGPDVLTAQIAQEAGVPRTHVYRHFNGKQALDLAVSRHIANQIGHRVNAALASRGTIREIIGASIDEHLSWVEAHPNLYRFLAQHAYAVRATGTLAADDAKAAFASELTRLIERYLQVLGAGTEAAERIVVGVVGLVDATAAWWLDRGSPPRSELTAELTERVWLIIDSAARAVGLTLDPDRELPPLPRPAARAPARR